MNEVVTVRPSNLSIAPLFQSSVSESPSNIFRQVVSAQSADARRMSWVWRSPGANLLLNPNAHIQFQIKVTVPHNFSKAINCAPLNARQNVAAPTDDGAGTFTGINSIVNKTLAAYLPEYIQQMIPISFC